MFRTLLPYIILLAFIGLLCLYSVHIGVWVGMLILALDVYFRWAGRKHQAKIEADKKTFLAKYEGTVTFHITTGKKNQQFFEEFGEQISSSVHEVVQSADLKDGWKPWPLFMPKKQSVPQPFFLKVKGGLFHFTSIKDEVQQYLNGQMPKDEMDALLNRSMDGIDSPVVAKH